MVKVKGEIALTTPKRDSTCKWKKVPKRVSGYQFFLRACLDEMKSKYPDSSIVLSEVSKLCAENWQCMGDVPKKRFQDEAEAVNTSNCLQSTQSGKLKNKMRVYMPKQPLSAYILFCKEWRPVAKRKYPDVSMGQISRILSEMWLNSDAETKQKYEKLSQKRRQHCQKELNVSEVALVQSNKQGEVIVEAEAEETEVKASQVEVKEELDLN